MLGGKGVTDFDNDPFGFDDFNSSDTSGDLDTSDGNSFDFGESDFNFDEPIDFGNSDNKGSPSFEGSFDDIDKGYASEHKDNSEQKKIIKTSVIAIGVGLLIILVAFSMNRIASNKKATTKTESPKQQAEVIHNNPVVNNATENGWVQVSIDNQINFDSTIESSFTVTNIRHYALVTNKNNDKQLKSLVTGNISGLVGTYEIEIPFDKAQNLSVGAVFEVSYKITELNGYSVISGIKY